MYNPIIELLSCFVENIIIIQIMNYFLDLKHKQFQSIFILFFTALALTVNTMQEPIYLLVALGILNVYAQFNYSGTSKYKCVISSSVFILNVFISFSIITLLTSFSNLFLLHLQQDGMFYISAFFVSKFLLIMIFFILRNILKTSVNHPVNWQLIFSEMIFFFISLLYIFYIFIENLIGAYHSVVIICIQTMILVTTLYVYAKYFSNLREQEKLINEEIASKSYIEAMEKEHIIIAMNQKVMHDLKKQVFLFKQYLEQKDLVELNRVLYSIDEIQIPTLIDTPNKALNHLLNSKSYIMSHHNIQFTTFIENTLDFIETSDLMLMFGMLLDQVIALSKDTINAYIKFESKDSSRGVIVNIQCKCTTPINECDTASNLNTLEKYNGIDSRSNVNNVFTHKILFQKIEVNE